MIEIDLFYILTYILIIIAVGATVVMAVMILHLLTGAGDAPASWPD